MIFYAKAKKGDIVFSNQKEKKDYALSVEGKNLIIEADVLKEKRTLPQNDALHVYCKNLAKELNDSGANVQVVLKEVVDLDWNKDLVKELLWRPVQQAILGKKSTRELKKIGEIDKVYEHINRYIGEKFFVHVPFPHKEIKEIDRKELHKNLEEPKGKITAF